MYHSLPLCAWGSRMLQHGARNNVPPTTQWFHSCTTRRCERYLGSLIPPVNFLFPLAAALHRLDGLFRRTQLCLCYANTGRVSCILHSRQPVACKTSRCFKSSLKTKQWLSKHHSTEPRLKLAQCDSGLLNDRGSHDVCQKHFISTVHI
jgi:hypothetical protein